MTDPIAEFKRWGESASHHYADDTCQEWKKAHKDMDRAMNIYDTHPEHHAEMQKIARGFLWSFRFELQRRADER